MKLIFFSSHTATWYFAIAEATIANALQKRGHQVLFITPGNLFKGVSNKKHEDILRQEFGLGGYEIGDILTKNDFKKINIILSKLTKENFVKLKIDNISIGKIALYEFLLIHKKMSVKITNNEWKKCLVEIRNTLLSFVACQKIIKKEKPDKILMYNALYSVNHVWERYADKVKIPVYFLHHGLNMSDMENTLIVAKENMLTYIDRLKKKWTKYKKSTINKSMAVYVTNHFHALLKAKHPLIYSSPKKAYTVNIRDLFKININQNILLATMSSYDEKLAAEFVGGRNKPSGLIFKDQNIWIDELINYVKDRKELFLIIRVHPREFPNKRDGVKSEHAKFLEDKFVNLPRNVKVNWPKDNLSLYDLASAVDVVLIAWSNVGVEMSLLGIPVITYAKDLVLYPYELNFTVTDKKDYFNKIKLALKKTKSYEKVKMTYRWLSYYYCAPIIRLKNKSTPKKLTSETNINPLFYISNYIFSKLPLDIRSKFINKKRLINDCVKALEENVDVTLVEKMLINDHTDIVDFNNLYLNKISSEDEDKIIKNEVKKLYNSLSMKFTL